MTHVLYVAVGVQQGTHRKSIKNIFGFDALDYLHIGFVLNESVLGLHLGWIALALCDIEQCNFILLLQNIDVLGVLGTQVRGLFDPRYR